MSAAKTGYVYLILNTVNGKRYVGQTIRSLKARWRQHKHSAKIGSFYPIHSALRKYGADKFTITLLETVIGSREDLSCVEKRHIQQLASLSPLGYNLSEGGEGVDFTNPVIREKHRQSVRNRSPEWQQHTVEAAQRRASDPEWRVAVSVRIKRLFDNSEFRQDNNVTLQHARSVSLSNMLARDALRTPEELEAIVKHREAVRRSVLKRQSSDYLSQAEKDALLPNGVLAKRLKQRERVRRSRAKATSQLTYSGVL
jgi:group I intron endonuclease